jgi:hypothetical protein
MEDNAFMKLKENLQRFTMTLMFASAITCSITEQPQLPEIYFSAQYK